MTAKTQLSKPPVIKRCTCPGQCEIHDPKAPEFPGHARAFDPDALDNEMRELPERPPPGWPLD